MAKSNLPDIIRFWNKVIPVESGCWEWSCGISKNGYGKFKLNKKTIPAHRAAWEFEFGEIPKGMYICHKCDNRKCCYPGHLFVGTQKDNIQDMIQKGRIHYGSSRPMSKLLESDVAIIKAFKGINGALSSMARAYSVSVPSISAIMTGKTWSAIRPRGIDDVEVIEFRKHNPFFTDVCRCGEKSAVSKLSNKEVIDIRALFEAGVTVKKLCSLFGTSNSQTRRIIKKQSWKHI